MHNLFYFCHKLFKVLVYVVLKCWLNFFKTMTYKFSGTSELNTGLCSTVKNILFVDAIYAIYANVWINSCIASENKLLVGAEPVWVNMLGVVGPVIWHIPLLPRVPLSLLHSIACVYSGVDSSLLP